MKKLGILIRPENTEEENKQYFSIAKQYGLDIILLDDLEDNDFFQYKCKMCDGYLLTGGNKKGNYDDLIISMALRLKKPLLGICQGMQSMAIFDSEFEIRKIGDNSHHLGKNHRHLVFLKKGKVKEIIGKDFLLVNSYHYETVTGSKHFDVTGFSEEGFIEVIENKNHPFQVGVQWHPERMLSESVENQKIIENFVQSIQYND